MTARNTVRPLRAVALVLVLAALLPANAHAFSKALVPVDGGAIRAIGKLRTETNRWRSVMGLKTYRSELGGRELAAAGAEYRHWVLDLWRKRARAAARRAQNPPNKSAWLCIHRHERHPYQGWRTNTGNGYYGGLQMDISFQRAYGARLLQTKGTADRWTPLEQIWVAVKAHRSGLGFYPWPNTARACGLL